MKPMFIDLVLGKFQRCCFPHCDGDSSRETYAIMPDGETFFLSACNRKGHYEYVERAAQKVLKKPIAGLKLKEGILQHKRVFVQPVGMDQKCRWDLWQEYLKDGGENAQAQTEPPPVNLTVVPVCEGWVWVANSGKWMNPTGTPLWMPDMTDQELVCSVLQIVKVNYTKITKRISWIRDLVLPREMLKYPEGELFVGTQVAGKKLDEFKQLAEERGLL